MSRTKTLAALTILGLAAAGCATPGPNQLTAANNPSLNSVHQPVVQRTDFVLDLATDGGGVPAADLDRLKGWFDSIGLAYGDTVAVDEGHGFGGNARNDVARVAADYGLALADAAPVTAGSVGPGTVRVIASRATASVAGCPAWTTNSNGITPQQNTTSNYGCATNANLAAMIANPEDLVRGREPSATGGALTAGRAIRSYRENQPTGRQGLPATSTTSGR